MCVMCTAEAVLLTCWLPARQARIGVDAQVLVQKLDLDVVADLGINPNRGEAGLTARVAVLPS
jgi:hypothetical protein